jgi:hypothetical protein
MKKNVSKLQLGGSILKILSLTIILAFIAPVMTNAQAGKVNFAGSWVYNAEKSTQPPAGGGGQGGGNRAGGDFVVTQDANTLTTVRTRTGQDGTPQTTTVVATLDGKEKVNTTARGESKLTANWSTDGKSLTIVTKSVFGDREMTSTAVWSLIDAKTLSVVSSRPNQDGAMTSTTAIYNLK